MRSDPQRVRFPFRYNAASRPSATSATLRTTRRVAAVAARRGASAARWSRGVCASRGTRERLSVVARSWRPPAPRRLCPLLVASLRFRLLPLCAARPLPFSARRRPLPVHLPLGSRSRSRSECPVQLLCAAVQRLLRPDQTRSHSRRRRAPLARCLRLRLPIYCTAHCTVNGASEHITAQHSSSQNGADRSVQFGFRTGRALCTRLDGYITLQCS